MEIIKTKNGEFRYKEKVRLDSGRTLTKTFVRKTDAIAWKRKVEFEKVQGILGVKAKIESRPFDQVAELWFAKASREVGSRTIANFKSNLRGKVIPHFGKTDVASISLTDIEKLKHGLVDKGLNPKTINKVMTMVRQIFIFAHEREYVAALPFSRSLLMKTYNNGFKFYEEWEIRQLLRGKDQSIWPIVFLAVHTGMRLGEILGLCWDKVNYSSNRIEIQRTLGARGVMQNRTKSGKPRYFPLSPKLTEFFKEHRKYQRNPEFVFTTESGDSFNPDHFCQRYFHPYCKKVGVRMIRFHDLRHTFASHFMMKGGNIWELKELLGHHDFEMTQIYAHLSPNHLEKAASVVDFGISYGQDKAVGSFLVLAE